MSEADLLRQRAESLLSMAMKARERGQFDYADTLIAEAAQFINDAEALAAAEAHADRQPNSPRRKNRTRPE
jgi:hypothetical protein